MHTNTMLFFCPISNNTSLNRKITMPSEPRSKYRHSHLSKRQYAKMIITQHLKGILQITKLSPFLNIFKKFIYLTEGEREREREHVSRGSSRGRRRSRLLAEQGARHGTGSQDPRIMTWSEGRYPLTEPPRRPQSFLTHSSCLSPCTVLLYTVFCWAPTMCQSLNPWAETLTYSSEYILWWRTRSYTQVSHTKVQNSFECYTTIFCKNSRYKLQMRKFPIYQKVMWFFFSLILKRKETHEKH